jgi:hypothetical protein
VLLVLGVAGAGLDCSRGEAMVVKGGDGQIVIAIDELRASQ